MPTEATLSLVPPRMPGFSADEIVAAVTAGLAEREAGVADTLRRERQRVLVARAVLAQEGLRSALRVLSWRMLPSLAAAPLPNSSNADECTVILGPWTWRRFE